MRYGDDHSPEVDFQGSSGGSPPRLMPLVTPISAAHLISARVRRREYTHTSDEADYVSVRATYLLTVSKRRARS